MSGRPRRSAAPTSYTHLLKPLSDSEPSRSGSESDHPENGDTLTNSAKGKGKVKTLPKSKGKGKAAKQSSSDDGTDGSVFEAASSDEEESHHSGGDTASSSSSGAPVEEDSVSETYGTDEERPARGRTRGWGPKPRRSGAEAKPTRQALVPSRTKASTGPSNRARAPPSLLVGAFHGAREHEKMAAMKPAWEPPGRFFDGKGGGETVHPALRLELTEALFELAFGPTEWSLQDLGWWKGKWDKKGIYPRWGGWYPDVQAHVGPVVTGRALDPYLPRQLYPAKPRPLQLFVKTLPKEEIDATQILDPDLDVEEGAMEVDPIPESTDLKILMGPVDAPVSLALPRFRSRRLQDFWPSKRGFIANVGGPVFALAWAPRADTVPICPKEYLALATQSAPHELGHSTIPAVSLIQLWSLSDASEFSHDISFCVDAGEALDLQWCPKGGEGAADEGKPKLGMLAAVFSDGSVEVFAVPNPADVRKAKKAKEGIDLFIKLSPVIRLSLPNTKLFSLTWASHETMVCGCMNGDVAVWSISDIIVEGTTEPLPRQYFSLHTAPIRSLVAVRIPPLSAALDGTVDTDSESPLVVTVGYDGHAFLIDLRDPGAPLAISSERSALTATAFEPYTGKVYVPDRDGEVRLLDLRPSEFATARLLSRNRGTIWSIASSDHHPFVSVAGAAGTCTVANATRTQRKNSHFIHYSHKLFLIDFNRKSGEYRMLDRFLPQERPELRPGTKLPDDGTMVGAWLPEVGVLSTSWHPSIQRADLLATGTACGAVRIDYVGVLGDSEDRGPRATKMEN